MVIAEKIEAYVRPSCDDCKGMLKFLNSVDLDVSIIDITRAEGYEKSKGMGLFMLPTVLIKDEMGNVLNTAFCVDAVKRMIGKV